PFYMAAKEARAAVWTDSYAFWGGNERGEVPGVSYVVPLYAPQTNLIGVLDVDFDLFDLSTFLGEVARSSEGYCFVVEERRDGSRIVVAHPEPNQIIDPGTRLFPTNSMGITDPVARAILGSISQSPSLLVASS